MGKPADQEHCALQRTPKKQRTPSHCHLIGQCWGLGSRGSELTTEGAGGRVRAGLGGPYLLEGAACTLTAIQVITGHLCKAKTLGQAGAHM